MGCTERTRRNVMGRRLNHLVLGVVEYVSCREKDLGVTVLRGLRGRHRDDLAGMPFNKQEPATPARRGLRPDHK